VSTVTIPAPSSTLSNLVKARRTADGTKTKRAKPPGAIPRFGFTGFDRRCKLVKVDTPAPNYEDHPGPSQVVIYSETLCFLHCVDDEQELREFNRTAKHLTIAQKKRWEAMSQGRQYRGVNCWTKQQKHQDGDRRRFRKDRRLEKGAFSS